MPQQPQRHPVTQAMKQLLNSTPPLAVTGVERFEVGRAPEAVPKTQKTQELIHGYGIIYPLTSPLFWGSLGRPDECLTATYQITAVGRTDEHVQLIADAVRMVLLLRTTGGSFEHALTPAGHSVIDRRPREAGMPEQLAGGIWQIPDVYDLEVQANA